MRSAQLGEGGKHSEGNEENQNSSSPHQNNVSTHASPSSNTAFSSLAHVSSPVQTTAPQDLRLLSPSLNSTSTCSGDGGPPSSCPLRVLHWRGVRGVGRMLPSRARPAAAAATASDTLKLRSRPPPSGEKGGEGDSSQDKVLCLAAFAVPRAG